MKLSRLDRLKLMNQYLILAALEESDEYDNAIRILDNGFEGEYDSLFQGYDDTLSEENCRFVRDVLCMYEDIQRIGNDSKDKKITAHFNYRFKGFDGNNEGNYMCYARYLTKNARLWSYLEFGDDGCNSHMPRVDKYRDMLTKWEKIEDKGTISAETILEILEA